jgi:hypothetical protein
MRRSLRNTGVVAGVRRVGTSCDFGQDGGIVDRRWNFVRDAVGDLTQRAAQRFSGPCFRQSVHDQHGLERRHRADLGPHQPDRIGFDLRVRPRDTLFEHDEAHRQLALELVGDADHRAFGDIGLLG